MSFNNPQDFYKSLQQFSNNINDLRRTPSGGSTNDGVTKLIEQAGKKYILENPNTDFVDEIRALDETLGDDFNKWFYGESKIAENIREEAYLAMYETLYVDNFYTGCSTSTLSDIAGNSIDTYLNTNIPDEDLYGTSVPGDIDAEFPTSDPALEALKFYLPNATDYSLTNPDSNISNVVNSDGNLSKCNLEPCNTQNFSADRAACIIQSAAEQAFQKAVQDALVREAAKLNPGDIIEGAIDVDSDGVPVDQDLLERFAEINNLVSSSGVFNKTQPLSFKEQCFLLSHIQTFSALKMILDAEVGLSSGGALVKENPSVDTEGAAGNRSLMIHGDPFAFLNRLTQSANKQYFFDITPDSLSALQPMIRLFKIITDDNGNEQTVEISFDSHYTNSNDLGLNNLEARGHGVGIRNFSFAYEANNPFALKKSITAKLVIFANNFGELLKDRAGAGTNEDGTPVTPSPQYKYTDLALKTGSKKAFEKVKTNPQLADVALQNFEKLNFRLKAVVGYADPAAAGEIGAINYFRNAVYDSFVTLNLTPTIHEFDIDELGRVTFSLNYLAYVEDFFDQPMFDIFTDVQAKKDQIIRKLSYSALNSKCETKGIPDLLNTDDAKAKIEEEKVQNFQSLMNNMIAEDRVRLFDIGINDLTKYRAGGPLQDIDPALMDNFLSKYIYGLVNIPDKDLGDPYIKTAQLPDYGVQQAILKDGLEVSIPPDEEDKISTGASNAEIAQLLGSDPIQTIPFFWVSDLVDVILKYVGKFLVDIRTELQFAISETVQKATETGSALSETETTLIQSIGDEVSNYQALEKNYKRFRLILGPVELVNANVEGKIINTFISNFGDIPISVKYFMEWMTNKVLKTDRVDYPLPKFLNDFFNTLIRDFLNNDLCYGNTAKQKTRVSQAAITAYNTKSDREGVDDIQYLMNKQGATRLDLEGTVDRQPIPQPVLSVMGKREDPRNIGTLNQETNYMVYFASRTQPTEKMTGDRAYDHSRGIWHYILGQNKGILKNISLQKTDAKYLPEVRFEQEGYDGLQQLLLLYDAHIKSYLDPTSFPGNYIYVEPKGFDPSLDYDITKLGIGGYYMITRSEHTLGPGMAESNITAKWVAQIESDSRSAEIQRENNLCDAVQEEREKSVSYSDAVQKVRSTPGLSNISDLILDTTTSTQPPVDNGTSGDEYTDLGSPQAEGRSTVTSPRQ